MPPAAMASRRQADHRASDRRSPVRACRRSRKSRLMAWGNLGARPKPPQAGIVLATRSGRRPRRGAPRPGRAWSGRLTRCGPMAAVSWPAWSTSSPRPVAPGVGRRRRHSSTKPGMPAPGAAAGSRCRRRTAGRRGSGTRSSASRPGRSCACTASMYTASTSGRSSRSTLTLTNSSFITAAVASSSKLSWAMTWHQWQAE